MESLYLFIYFFSRNLRKRMGVIVIHTIEGYKRSRRQICTFRGAHVNPPTKIVPAKWGSPDIRFDSEHNRLSHGRL